MRLGGWRDAPRAVALGTVLSIVLWLFNGRLL